MILDPRLLRVEFTVDDDKSIVTYGEGLDIRFTCSKNILGIQNYARIDINNVRGESRANLLKQFNQFKLRTLKNPYVPIRVMAGRESTGASLVYLGASLQCSVTPPPDVGMTLQAGTQQIDKTKWVKQWPPSGSTFKDICVWAANTLGRHLVYQVEESVGKTPCSAIKIPNFGAGQWVTIDAIPMLLQVYFPDQVAAYVDDDMLVVRDIWRVVPEMGEVTLGHGTDFPFIGIPEWTEFGIKGKVIYNPNIRLGCKVNCTSIMNPTINGSYVVGKLDYELTSRDTPFYVTFTAYPPAQSSNGSK